MDIVFASHHKFPIRMARAVISLILASLVHTDHAWGCIYGSCPPSGLSSVHPRVISVPEERAQLIERVKYAPTSGFFQGVKSDFAEFTKTTSQAYQIMQKLEAGTAISDSEGLTYSRLLLDGSLAPYIDPISHPPAVITRALMAFVRGPVKLSVTGNSHNFARYTEHLGLAYDFAYGFLTASEANEVTIYLTNLVYNLEAYLDAQVYGFKPGFEAMRGFNFVPIYVGAFAIAAAALEGTSGYQSRWLTKARQSMIDFITYGIGVDGDPEESIHYFTYGMQTGSRLLDLLHRRGVGLFSDQKLVKVGTYFTYDMFPWKGDFNSNADTGDYTPGVGEVFARLSMAYPTDQATQWAYQAWLSNQNGQFHDSISGALWAPPTHLAPSAPQSATELGLTPSRHFAKFGQVYHRSSFATDGLYLQTQAMPTGGPTHQHADRNSFTLAARGRLWAIDPGFGSKHDLDHNAVMVDGKGGGWFPHQGFIRRFSNQTKYSLSIGDAKLAYDCAANGGNMMMGLQCTAYNPVVRANRTVVVYRDAPRPYALLVDDIVKDANTHTYEWPMLMPEGTRFNQIDATTAMLDGYEEMGAQYLVPGNSYNAKLEIPFSVATSGQYKVYLLMGRPHESAWHWGGYISLNQDPRVRFIARKGDDAPTHWQMVRVDDGPDWVLNLGAGSHKLFIDPISPVKYFAVAVVPAALDPRTVGGLSLPAGSSRVDFGALSLPQGWSKFSVARSPKLLVKVLSPSQVSMSASFYVPTQPRENGVLFDRSFRFKVTALAVEPKFRVVLYPHDAGDPLPTFESASTHAKVFFPDGRVQTYTFGSDPSIAVSNLAGVTVTEGNIAPPEPPANTAPTIVITSPSGPSSLMAGSSITFAGAAQDFEQGVISNQITWSSNLYGALGVGSSITTSGLGIGTHTITAKVTDQGGLSASASVSVVIKEPIINTAPVTRILAPASGIQVYNGSVLTFSGESTDREDGNISSQIEWISSLNGLFARGASVNVSSLSVGTHTIYARAKDSSGIFGMSQSITVNVVRMQKMQRGKRK